MLSLQSARSLRLSGGEFQVVVLTTEKERRPDKQRYSAGKIVLSDSVGNCPPVCPHRKGAFVNKQLNYHRDCVTAA